MTDQKRARVARALIGISLFFILFMMFVEGPYIKIKHSDALMKQKHFYDKYGSFAESGDGRARGKYDFEIFENAFQTDKVFLVSNVSGDYVITYGSGRQFICSYFPEKINAGVPEVGKLSFAMRVVPIGLVFVFLVASFIMLSNSSSGKV